MKISSYLRHSKCLDINCYPPFRTSLRLFSLELAPHSAGGIDLDLARVTTTHLSSTHRYLLSTTDLVLGFLLWISSQRERMRDIFRWKQNVWQLIAGDDADKVKPFLVNQETKVLKQTMDCKWTGVLILAFFILL